MTSEILALGDRFSAAYLSISETVRSFGKITYRDEKSFENVESILDFIRNSSFDAVLMPNPYGNQRRLEVYKKLRHWRFPIITFDRGGLPNSWFFDSGFNADSETYHPLKWDHALSSEETDRVRAYIKQVQEVLNPLEAQGRRVGGEVLRAKLGIGDKKMLFVALQRPSDTTIKHFSSPMQNIDNFYKIVAALPERIKGTLADWVVIAKKHPLEVERPELPVTFADDAHINDLIEAADAVLTVNSGTGLLSMLWDKPVLLAGTAYYAHPKLNRQIRSIDDLEYGLRTLPEVDPDLRDRFVHHLVNQVYSFGSFHTELVRQEDGGFRNITRKIEFDIVRLPEVLKKKEYSL